MQELCRGKKFCVMHTPLHTHRFSPPDVEENKAIQLNGATGMSDILSEP